MRSMSKSELAAAAGVSERTLMRWLRNPKFKDKLAHYQLTNQQKLLPGKLIKEIIEHYAIDID